MSGDHTRLPPTRGEGQGLAATRVSLEVARRAVQAAQLLEDDDRRIILARQVLDGPEAPTLSLSDGDRRAVYFEVPRECLAAVRALLQAILDRRREAYFADMRAASIDVDALFYQVLLFEGVATKPAADGEARQAKPAGDRTQDLPPGGHSHEG